MADMYARAHFLVNLSWTEGVPQVLIEGMAAGLPVIATDVGGVREALGEGVALIPAGNLDAAAQTVERLAADAQARASLVSAALEVARRHTLEAQLERLATFLRRHA